MKKGLSLDDHKDIGMELYRIHERLVHLSVKIANAYPLRSGAFSSLDRARVHLGKARSELEEKMFKQHGAAGRIDFYYPGASGSLRNTIISNTKEDLHHD